MFIVSATIFDFLCDNRQVMLPAIQSTHIIQYGGLGLGRHWHHWPELVLSLWRVHLVPSSGQREAGRTKRRRRRSWQEEGWGGTQTIGELSLATEEHAIKHRKERPGGPTVKPSQQLCPPKCCPNKAVSTLARKEKKGLKKDQVGDFFNFWTRKYWYLDLFLSFIDPQVGFRPPISYYIFLRPSFPHSPVFISPGTCWTNRALKAAK